MPHSPRAGQRTQAHRTPSRCAPYGSKPGRGWVGEYLHYEVGKDVDTLAKISDAAKLIKKFRSDSNDLDNWAQLLIDNIF